MKKTNVMRMLDKAGIPYVSREYAYEEKDLSGVHAAAELGFDCSMVFKTLVARGDKTGPAVFCIPVDKELDLKKAASASGNKSLSMLHVKDLPGLTGYLRGGCSPIGMKKSFPTYFDQSIENCKEVSVSAGARGCQVLLDAQALIRFVDGHTASLTMS